MRKGLVDPTSAEGSLVSVADELVAVVDEAAERLKRTSASVARLRPAPDAWLPGEIIGHLIDSAVNKHQRFVRAQVRNPLTFPGYAQEHWVRSQDYQSSDWTELVTLGFLVEDYLEHLRHHLSQVDAQLVRS